MARCGINLGKPGRRIDKLSLLQNFVAEAVVATGVQLGGMVRTAGCPSLCLVWRVYMMVGDDRRLNPP